MALALCCFAVNACHDDAFDAFLPTGGNDVDVAFAVDLPPLAAASMGSRGSAGDIIREINTLHLYIYDGDGTSLLYHCGKDGLTDFYYDKDGNTDWPKYPYASGNDYQTSQGEHKTPRATFKLKDSPFAFETGKTYQIYVTANVDVPEGNFDTAYDLKQYAVDWDADDTRNNAQMMGMFSMADENVEGAPVTFDKTNSYYLHAWLVRCASKVTVDFNTDGLNDNVWIYLHNVSIRNVPMHCHLGSGNTATQDYGVLDKGESIVYAPASSSFENAEDEFSSWPMLTRGSGLFGSDHSETAEALYFYENLQGTGKSKKQVDPDKPGGTQSGSVSWPDGVSEGNYGWRDEKPFGTYIEVEAFYRSSVKGNEGRGRIVYRFMLGMDADKDFNSYRNHHFKLTLNFRGNANDVDWHIDYQPQSDNPIYVPEPFYISYLYGESVEIPITIDGHITDGTKVIAEIVENNWKPMDAPTSIYWTGPVQSSTDLQFDGPWHGFLSLRPTNSNENHIEGMDEVTNSEAIGRENTIRGTISNNSKAYLMSYWYGGIENMSTTDPEINISNLFTSAEIDANERMHVPMQGYREFDTSKRDGIIYDTSEKDNHDTYEILESNNGGKIKTHLYLPLYTRALFMVRSLGYSGANPYQNYQRKAVVKITAWIDEVVDGEIRSVKYSKLCDVIQVRRIINPCGIYRERGNNKPFTVNLCSRTAEGATSFMPFASEGKWSAEIESGDAGFITLNGQPKVQGRTGEYIKFQVHFIPSSTKINRHAVILVKYHDYTCKHRILVRQGYDPEPLIDDGVSWHCFNLRGGNTEADSPLDPGSLFRFGNLDFAIDASSNKSEEVGVAPDTKEFDVVGRDGKIAGQARWWVLNAGLPTLGSSTPNLCFQACPDLDADDVNFRQYFEVRDVNGNVINPGRRTRLPKYDDWITLRDNAFILYTYGICYDGTASGTAMAAREAFNYLYSNPDRDGSGMRGVFLYNQHDGRNLFLPIGASGFGRRKNGNNDDMPGTLRYANRSVYMPSDLVMRMPTLWNIKDNIGAIYWGFPETFDNKVDIWDSKRPVPSFSSWDINLSTYDFNHFSDNAYNFKNYNSNNAGLRYDDKYFFSDAALMRLVDE